MIGRVVGNFRILAELGAGGMGIVYKAQDIRLDRFLALKFLKPERVSNEFRRRFFQEARASSALHHPSIVHIYDIGEWEGRDYIAMEYVEGSTLHAIIQQRTLSLEETLSYALQVADALATAHAAGIVHRDLKPRNLMITPTGRVKVVDFGLAKLAPIQPEPITSTQAATVTSSQTVTGIPIGSPAYMSPEQAAGKEVDARGDIFAFGSVLFEMLTGKRAFSGDSLVEVMGAVMHLQVPHPSSINPQVSEELDAIVARCLEKKPADRFQKMSEVARALGALGTKKPSLFRGVRARPVAIALGLAALLSGGYFAYRSRARSAPGPVLSTAQLLTFDAGLNIDPSISVDGKFVAYASDRAGKGNLDIWFKQIDGGDPIQLTSDPADDHDPNLSPDGTKVAFRSERKGGGIYLVPALGGRETLLIPEGRRPRFSPDGKQIAYWKGVDDPFPLLPGNGNSFVFDLATLQSRPIAPDFAAAADPVWSPDGKSMLTLGLKSSDLNSFAWWIVPLAGGSPVKCPVLTAELYVPYAWLGDSVYYDSQEGRIYKVRVDPKSGRTGQPENLTPGTPYEYTPSPAASGRVIYAGSTEKTNIFKLPLDADQGKITGAPQSITNDLDENNVEAISANGQRIAYIRAEDSGASYTTEIWVADLATGQVHALVNGERPGGRPKGLLSISPDGASVTWREPYASVREIFSTPFEGGVSSRFCGGCTGFVVWSPDGKWALYQSSPAVQTLLIREIASGKESAYLGGGNRQIHPSAISRDGHWVVFAAVNRANQADYALYVAPFRPHDPPAEAEWVRVLSAEDAYPAASWSPGGNLLYFFSRRDGHICLWALRLDRLTKRPAGEPFALQHFHAPGVKLIAGSSSNGPAIGPQHAVVAFSEISSGLWLLAGKK